MVVPEEHATGSTLHKDTEYYFCSSECKEEFDIDPELYAAEDPELDHG
jgi:YHS domain-containing protein